MQDLLPLLLFFLFIALRFLGSRKPQQRPGPAEETPLPAERNDEMDEALRQIREALGMPDPSPRPAPVPEPVAAPPPPPPPRPTPPRPRPTPPPVRPPVFYDDAPARPKPLPRPAPRALPAKPPAPPRADSIQELLDSPADLQKALVLSEIFGPPRSQQRRTR